MYFNYDSVANKVILHEGEQARELREYEINSLISSLSDYLANENLFTIVSHLKATLGTQSTLIFSDTKKIHEIDHKVYGISLGLFAESSQTAYNLHKSRRKSDS